MFEFPVGESGTLTPLCSWKEIDAEGEQLRWHVLFDHHGYCTTLTIRSSWRELVATVKVGGWCRKGKRLGGSCRCSIPTAFATVVSKEKNDRLRSFDMVPNKNMLTRLMNLDWDGNFAVELEGSGRLHSGYEGVILLNELESGLGWINDYSQPWFKSW